MQATGIIDLKRTANVTEFGLIADFFMITPDLWICACLRASLLLLLLLLQWPLQLAAPRTSTSTSRTSISCTSSTTAIIKRHERLKSLGFMIDADTA